jgi:hypothetical protein
LSTFSIPSVKKIYVGFGAAVSVNSLDDNTQNALELR